MEANSKTMILHIITIVVNVLTLAVAAFLVFRAFEDPENINY